MTFDLCYVWNENEDTILVALFNLSWAAYGGTVDDLLYNYYISTFQLERIEIEDELGALIPVYKMGSQWWDATAEVFFETPISEQVCKMPEWI